MTIQDYKGHEISFRVDTGKFEVNINDSWKKFSSLQSAKNAIKKAIDSIVVFKPVDVLTVDQKGYNVNKYTIRKVKITGYKEETGYRRGTMNRYVTAAKDEKFRVGERYGNHELFDLKNQAILQKNIDETNKLEILKNQTENRLDKLETARARLSVNLDPKPEMGEV